MKKLLLTLACFVSGAYAADHAKKADLVIFSYNRPMQLYCLLESVEKYVSGLADIQVIYRADDEYELGYAQVKKAFGHAHYHRQGANPRADFKPLTEQAAFAGGSEYIIFAVDDNIVKDYVDLTQCIAMVEKTSAYGFYLRLGKNLTECYMLSCAQPVPALAVVGDDIYCWTIKDSLYDWCYPNTVDMTLYRKADIAPTITSLQYHSPNTLEAYWHNHHQQVINRRALCFGCTKVVNVPMNMVQGDYTSNRHMPEIPASELLAIFNKGLKIDIAPLHQIKNKGAHMEYVPSYVPRS